MALITKTPANMPESINTINKKAQQAAQQAAFEEAFNLAVELGVKHHAPSHKINNHKLYFLAAVTGRGVSKCFTYKVAK